MPEYVPVANRAPQPHLGLLSLALLVPVRLHRPLALYRTVHGLEGLKRAVNELLAHPE